MQLGLAAGRQHRLFSEPQLLQHLNYLLLLCDVPFSLVSDGFTSYPLSSPMIVTNAAAQQRKPGERLLCSSPGARNHSPCQQSHRYPCGHCLRHSIPLHTQQVSQREKSFGPCCLCIFPFSNTHTHKLREGRNVWHFCGDYLAEALLHFLATGPGS